MNKTFINDYIYNDTIWKIYDISNNDSLKYFNISNKNNFQIDITKNRSKFGE